MIRRPPRSTLFPYTTLFRSALIGADGVKSVVRQQYVGDAARVSGHVVYRAVVEKNDFPEDLRWNAASIWVGPNYHLVHYRSEERRVGKECRSRWSPYH